MPKKIWIPLVALGVVILAVASFRFIPSLSEPSEPPVTIATLQADLISDFPSLGAYSFSTPVSSTCCYFMNGHSEIVEISADVPVEEWPAVMEWLSARKAEPWSYEECLLEDFGEKPPYPSLSSNNDTSSVQDENEEDSAPYIPKIACEWTTRSEGETYPEPVLVSRGELMVNGESYSYTVLRESDKPDFIKVTISTGTTVHT